MGKLGNLAYNIGTSLNKEDIDNHRQGITPTTQTLQGLSTEDKLTHHTNNQALLDENKGQLEGEKESDGVWNQGVRPPLINTNNPNARRWNVNNNPHALTVRRETEAIRQTYPNFGGIQQIRNGPVTQREAAEYTAFRMFIRHGTNQTYADHNVAYREFLKSPYYQNLNRPNSTQLNIGLNNSNYNVARHEQINSRIITFGQNSNQINHTWRHLEAEVIGRNIAEPAIKNDLERRDLNSIPIGTTKGFEITINGQQVQYYIHRIGINQYNIGRSHVKR
ncbi:hypothetical protein [Moraxella bovoculi]|uniref:hypothetical protein n=1 Tax=Moraxella bovoculi TaxID=386891 RepID=UPI000624DD34|nr:hypothetical protein [Moraxella bovoculi]AKG15990.1 hypothetical protein AAX08_08905 [Moraxella bovoculi]AKG17677.1 hypothetical protein AAX10_08545 [Moraxella bovoculi]